MFMFIWHEKLIPVLTNEEILSQHQKICLSRAGEWKSPKKKWGYIGNYNPQHLVNYHKIVIQELRYRGFKPCEKWVANDGYRGTKKPLMPKEERGKAPLENIYPEHNAHTYVENLEMLIEKQRERLHEQLQNYGIGNKKVHATSRKLDILINILTIAKELNNKSN